MFVTRGGEKRSPSDQLLLLTSEGGQVSQEQQLPEDREATFLCFQGPAPVGLHLLEATLHFRLQHEDLEEGGGHEVEDMNMDMAEGAWKSVPGFTTLYCRQFSTV